MRQRRAWDRADRHQNGSIFLQEGKLNGRMPLRSEFYTHSRRASSMQAKRGISMAVTVKKLEGTEVPEALRRGEGQQIFEVTDVDGSTHYRENEVDAAKLVVELSEEARKAENR
jgi:hypothetical protein